MILLQQWEPTVCDQFPSKISFNVRIHGIPLHFWSEKTILTIGHELGKCSIRDEKEAKIWVEVNGLQPLQMKMEIELPTDDILEVEFEYIKIEKHCFTCFSLFHEESNCHTGRLMRLLPRKGIWVLYRALLCRGLKRKRNVMMTDVATLGPTTTVPQTDQQMIAIFKLEEVKTELYLEDIRLEERTPTENNPSSLEQPDQTRRTTETMLLKCSIV